MNILFRDKLSQQAWHSTLRFNDSHREQLSRWLSDFLAGAWCSHQIPDPAPGYNRPDWMQQKGCMGQLTIQAPWNQLRLVNGRLLAREFAWVVEMLPVDKYGHPDGDPQHVIHGALVDHFRDPDHPRWSSHT